MDNMQNIIVPLHYTCLDSGGFSIGLQGCGGLIKIYYKAQPPYEVSTPLHCSLQFILSFLFTCKNPLKLPQKVSNYLSTTTLSGKLVKTPPFS